MNLQHDKGSWMRLLLLRRKREQSIQDVPISMNAISGDFISKNNITDFGNIELYVPGLDINETSPNGNNFSLRGIPNGGSFIGLSSVMDSYWNGVILPQELALGAMFDIERVEVLRGPQGALQGRPAPAGVIQTYTKRPRLDADSGYDGTVTARIRDDGGYSFEGGASAVLIPDELAVRVAGFWRDDNGRADYVNNSGQKFERKNKAARITFAWQPTESFDAVLVSQFDKREEPGGANYYTGNGVLGFVSPYENSRTTFDFDDYERKYIQHALELNADIGSHTLTSVTGYGTSDASWDIDFTRFLDSDLFVFQDRKREHITQEFRIESGENDVWDYMLGVYFSKSKLFFDSRIPALSRVTSQDERDEQRGIFTFNKFQLTDKSALQIGLRWQDYESFKEQTPIEFNDSDLTWSVQFLHELNESTNVYISYQRGFRPKGGISRRPDFNPVPDENFLFDSEISDSFELGLKGRLFDDRLMVNVSVYHQEFSDFPQATASVSTDANLDGVFELDNQIGPDLSTRYTRNIDLLAQGLELEWQAALSDKWTLSGSLARNHVETGDGIIPCSIFDEGGQAVFPAGEYFSTCDISGETLDGLRKLTGSLVSEYVNADTFDNMEWYVRGTYNYLGKKPTKLNTTIDDLDAVGVINLHAGFRTNDGIDFSLWVENLTDEQQIIDFLAGSDFANRYAFVNGFVEERRFGVSVGYNF